MPHSRIRIGLASFGTLIVAGWLGALGAIQTPPAAPASKALPPILFRDWPEGKKPDVALFLTGEQHSYIKFCGCSSPQLGGFERRFNFLAKLKESGWPVVALDLGDLVYRRTGSIQAQTLLKYATSMEALNKLNYSAIGVGQHEFNLPLDDGLAHYTLQKPDANPRVLAANLMDRVAKFPNGSNGSMIDEAVVVGGKAGVPVVGAIAVVAPSVRENIQAKGLKFDNNQEIIPRAIKAFDTAKVELRVLLYQGTVDEAKKAAASFPEFHVVLCRSAEEEPPAREITVGKTMIVNVGHKGRYVGVVGAFRKEKPGDFELHYQLVPMGDEYETDDDKAKDHPVLELLQSYAQSVKDDAMLARYPKTPHPMKLKFAKEKVAYIGSQACKACHEAEFKKWDDTKHSHAYEALVKYAKKPTLRQFDGECVICHTIGFAHETGFASEAKTPLLKHVGCENCHGPGNLHVQNPNEKAYYGFLSPWKVSPGDRVMKADGTFDPAMLNRIDAVCQKCHDTDNDPKFRFEEFWPKIDHSKKAQAP